MKEKHIDESVLNDALSNLQPIANQYFAHVTAGEHLKQRIIQSAYGKPTAEVVGGFWRKILRNAKYFSALGAAVIMALAFLTLQNNAPQPISTDTENPPVFINIPASGGDNSSTAHQDSTGAPSGGLMISQGNEVKHKAVWIHDANAFPYIQYGKSVYRLLDAHLTDRSLLGESPIGRVESESANSKSSDKAISNVVPVGTDIYYVPNMGKQILAVDNGGNIMVFQKYGSSAAKESLLPAEAIDMVQSAYIDSIGEIANVDQAKKFVQQISAEAKPAETAASPTDFMLIRFKNGLTLQYLVNNTAIQANGSFDIQNLYQMFMGYMNKE